ncbi:hypothetical protein [Methylophaga muralis]|uniref:Uncharacterized protein n=1 Tax=Methylophaga muralis TaxID=291169 RepID=A0A1E3GN57_9GAMM|nr:hypothetical protein [Methylophaga muralis]ODN65447.1 hypothetical protein A9E74_02758 [Methylophaga muralis]
MKTSDIGSNSDYAEEAFTFEQIGESSGEVLLEFGAPGVDIVRLQVRR